MTGSEERSQAACNPCNLVTGERPGPGPRGRPVVRWRRVIPVDPELLGPPVAASGVVFFTLARPDERHAGEPYRPEPEADRSWRHYLLAVAAGSGADLWEVELAGFPAHPVADGGVYVATDDGTVAAIETRTGRWRWRFAAGYRLRRGGASSPTVVDGVVYFGAEGYADGERAIVAVDAATGAERWRFRDEGLEPNCHSVAGGVVYAYAHGGEHRTGFRHASRRLVALDAVTGIVRWRRLPGAHLRSARRRRRAHLHSAL